MKHTITTRDVPRETFGNAESLFEKHTDQLNAYIDQLLWWNERINLVSRDVSRETVLQHVLHSLALSGLNLFKKATYIVDAGTGGGLPGLPVAIATPSKKIILNDLVTKKIRAVRQITRILGLENTQTNNGSIKSFIPNRSCVLISKHAFKINDLLTMVDINAWEGIILLKGVDFKDELEGVNHPLLIEQHLLDSNTNDIFYKDKSIVVIRSK